MQTFPTLKIDLIILSDFFFYIELETMHFYQKFNLNIYSFLNSSNFEIEKKEN